MPPNVELENAQKSIQKSKFLRVLQLDHQSNRELRKPRGTTTTFLSEMTKLTELLSTEHRNAQIEIKSQMWALRKQTRGKDKVLKTERPNKYIKNNDIAPEN